MKGISSSALALSVQVCKGDWRSSLHAQCHREPYAIPAVLQFSHAVVSKHLTEPKGVPWCVLSVPTYASNRDVQQLTLPVATDKALTPHLHHTGRPLHACPCRSISGPAHTANPALACTPTHMPVCEPLKSGSFQASLKNGHKTGEKSLRSLQPAVQSLLRSWLCKLVRHHGKIAGFSAPIFSVICFMQPPRPWWGARHRMDRLLADCAS